MDKKTYILNHFYSLYSVPAEVKEDLGKNVPDKIEWPNKLDEFLEKKKPFELNAEEVDWLDQRILN